VVKKGGEIVGLGRSWRRGWVEGEVGVGGERWDRGGWEGERRLRLI